MAVDHGTYWTERKQQMDMVMKTLFFLLWNICSNHNPYIKMNRKNE